MIAHRLSPADKEAPAAMSFSAAALVLAFLGLVIYRLPFAKDVSGFSFLDTRVITGPYGWHGWLFEGAVLCAVIAAITAISGKWLHRPLRNGPAITSFVMILSLFVASLALAPIFGKNPGHAAWAVWIIFATMVAFLLGCILFIVNLVWSLFRPPQAAR